MAKRTKKKKDSKINKRSSSSRNSSKSKDFGNTRVQIDDTGSRFFNTEPIKFNDLETQIDGLNDEEIEVADIEHLGGGLTRIQYQEADGDRTVIISESFSDFGPTEKISSPGLSENSTSQNSSSKNKSSKFKHLDISYDTKANIIYPETYDDVMRQNEPEKKAWYQTWEERKRLAEAGEWDKHSIEEINDKLAEWEAKGDEAFTKESRQDYQFWLDQKSIYDEYREKGIMPLFKPFGSNDLIPLDEANKIAESREVDFVIEKPYEEITDKMDENSYFVTTGNKIQTALRPFKLSEDMKSEGVRRMVLGHVFQRDSGVGNDNPAPKLAKPRKGIIVDSDDTGHYVAYWINSYAFNDPYKKNVYFDPSMDGDPKTPDPFKVNRFWIKSVINTRAFDRNRMLVDVMESSDQLGSKKALTYRSEGEVKQLNVSEQDLQIADIIKTDSAFIQVDLPNRRLSLEFDNIKKFNEDEPQIEFRPFNEQPKKLDTDTLLNEAVERLRLSPDQTQSLLESLHSSGWITYPRKTAIDPEDTAIELQEGRTLDEFQGTQHERAILEIVDQSQKAFEQGRSYIQKGEWVLKSGDLELKERGTIKGNERRKFPTEDFDLRVNRKGRDDSLILKKLQKHNIGTPATRTEALKRLRNAGVVLQKDGIYQLDKRGLYFVAGMRTIREFNVPTAIELNTLIDQVKENPENISELVNIASQWQFLDRIEFQAKLKENVENILEEESDLAYLESN